MHLSLNCHKTRVGLQGSGNNKQKGKKKKNDFLKSGKENGLNGFIWEKAIVVDWSKDKVVEKYFVTISDIYY